MVEGQIRNVGLLSSTIEQPSICELANVGVFPGLPVGGAPCCPAISQE